MAQKLSEIAPERGVFEDVERRVKKEEMVGKTFFVKAFSDELTGTDGKFHVILCKDDEGTFTTTANEILMKRLENAKQIVGLKEGDLWKTESYFKEDVEVTLQSRKSQSTGRDYFVFE